MGKGIVVGEASLLTVDDREEREEEIYCARRRRRTAGAETPKTFVLSIVVSCGSGDRERWRTELDFGGREAFKDQHLATALGRTAKKLRTIGDGRVLFALQVWSRG